ncbi:MAG: HEPN domain-containing protein [Bacteroidetes bacterium]|nr:HEPN domain-containing protein [Bacteroidota bacterium]MBU2584897.1 HEPN domain-containing protein [Bacteroidota bacterium]
MENNLLDLINYRKNRAFETLEEIKKLLKENMIFLAMNRIYYAGFYIVNALALLDGYSTSKHGQLIGYFNKTYIASGKVKPEIGDILNIAFRKRTAVDYHDFVTVKKEEANQYYEKIKIFVDTVLGLIEEKLKTREY